MPQDRYTHGHAAVVVNAHATRTIENSAAYLEPHLTPGTRLLDIGCGPGSITAEFAERLGPGNVLGVDVSREVIADAVARYPDTTARFEVMDSYALDVDDDTWDITHAHQVLQHVSDPVSMLREMRRVTRPGGIVAVRDADYAAMHWAPQSDVLDRWQDIYRSVAYGNDAEPDAGRHLLRWAAEAGFDDVTPSVSTWLFADPTGRDWWGGLWADRVLQSAMATQAVEGGHATAQELDEVSAAWRAWADTPNGWFVVVHGELLCRA